MDDRRLEQEVLRALFVEPRIDPTRVVVAVHRRVVTLSGSVGSCSEKSLAEDVVENLPSVKAVVDELTIQGLAEHIRETNKGRDYDDVIARILNALYWDVAIPQDRINVSYEDGVVTLSGDVDRLYQKSAAEADVWNIPEVKGIRNRIVVGPGPSAH